MIPRVAEQVDYEGELAVIIKDQIKDVVIGGGCPSTSLDTHVSTTSPSAPLSVAQGQLTRSKGFDTFAPLAHASPRRWIRPALTLRTLLNGKVMQEAHLADMIFSVPYLIHYLSPVHDAVPGRHHQRGNPPRGSRHEAWRRGRGVDRRDRRAAESGPRGVTAQTRGGLAIQGYPMVVAIDRRPAPECCATHARF